MSEFFIKEEMKLTGIDVSECAIEMAKDKLGDKAEFIVDNVCEMSKISNKYDLVFDSACLHCIVGEDRAKVFQTLKSKLKDNGTFIISCMIGDPKREGDFQFDPLTRVQYKNDGTHRYMPTYEMLINEIQYHGFSVKWNHINKNVWWDHFTGVLVKTSEHII